MAPKKNGFAVWLTGLPSSGKSVVAVELQRLLEERGAAVQILDSDELREHLTPHPTYTAEERKWFYDMIVFLAKILTGKGVNVLIAATGSLRDYRAGARSQIGRFAEVHIDCPEEVCRRRDPKGLWQKAERGEIDGLPGAGSPYEKPLAPELRIDSSTMSIKAAAERIFRKLCNNGFLDPPA